jgi:hypothetical protein
MEDVEADGSCFFSAASKRFFGSVEHSLHLRQLCVQFIGDEDCFSACCKLRFKDKQEVDVEEIRKNLYEDTRLRPLPESWTAYLTAFSSNTNLYAGFEHVAAVALLFGIPIKVYYSFNGEALECEAYEPLSHEVAQSAILFFYHKGFQLCQKSKKAGDPTLDLKLILSTNHYRLLLDKAEDQLAAPFQVRHLESKHALQPSIPTDTNPVAAVVTQAQAAATPIILFEQEVKRVASYTKKYKSLAAALEALYSVTKSDF